MRRIVIDHMRRNSAGQHASIPLQAFYLISRYQLHPHLQKDHEGCDVVTAAASQCCINKNLGGGLDFAWAGTSRARPKMFTDEIHSLLVFHNIPHAIAGENDKL